MFVDEDCVDSRSDVDDLRTRDCLYDESRPVRYEDKTITTVVLHIITQQTSSSWNDLKLHSRSLEMSLLARGTNYFPLVVSINVHVGLFCFWQVILSTVSSTWLQRLA